MTAFAQVNQTNARGEKQGLWEKFYEDSDQLRYRGEFQNGVPVGTFTYWHGNGKRMSVIDYRGTTGVGYATMFSYDGWKMAEGLFRGQEKDSVWTYYGPGGQMVSRETWVDGAKNGQEKTFYHDGKVAEVVNWSHGLREGLWIRKYNDGEMRARGTYQNDTLHGDIMYFDQNGRPEWVGTYVHGVKDGVWTTFEGGEPVFRETYDMGDLLEEECLRPEGCDEEDE